MRLHTFSSLWNLIILLSKKELKAKYTSTALGFLWILINPLLQMVVMIIVFSFFLKVQVKNYPVFIFSGLLSWTFFSVGLQAGISSLINNRDLLKKVSFPREVLPISAVLSHLFTFVLVLFLLILYSLVTSGIHASLLLLLPLVVLQTVLLIALSLFLSCLDIEYRDVSFIIQALLTPWFYLSPILYPISLVPEKYLFLYSLNPMAGIVTGYQSIFLNTPYIWSMLFSSVFVTFTLLLGGITLFRKRSKYFADWA